MLDGLANIDHSVKSLCEEIARHLENPSVDVTSFPDGREMGKSNLCDLKMLPGLLVPVCIHLRARHMEPMLVLDGELDRPPVAGLAWRMLRTTEFLPGLIIMPCEADARPTDHERRQAFQRISEIVCWRGREADWSGESRAAVG